MASTGNPISFELASFDKGDFATVGSFPRPIQKTVMPVISTHGASFRAVGTCFAITNTGLVLTAKHVVEEALGLDERSKLNRETAYPLKWLKVLYANSDTPGKTSSDVNGGFLDVNKIHFNDNLDLCVMHLNLPRHKDTGKLLPMPVFQIDPDIPAKGSQCVALGYHKMAWLQEEGGWQVIQSFSASRGTVKEVHFPIRDQGMLKFPCFETTATYEGGMSGGPILGEQGIVGVVCSNAYGSLIGPALGINVEFQEGVNFLLEALKNVLILKDQGNDVFQYQRDQTGLELNFGRMPILRFVLGNDDTPR